MHSIAAVLQVVHDALETVEAAFMAAEALAASRGTAFTYSALSFSATAPVQLVQRPTYVQNSPLSDFLTELYNTVSPPDGHSPRKETAAAAAVTPRTSSSDMVQAITAGCDKARVDWSGERVIVITSCTFNHFMSLCLVFKLFNTAQHTQIYILVCVYICMCAVHD
jgi:hypothetical protein